MKDTDLDLLEQGEIQKLEEAIAEKEKQAEEVLRNAEEENKPV